MHNQVKLVVNQEILKQHVLVISERQTRHHHKRHQLYIQIISMQNYDMALKSMQSIQYVKLQRNFRILQSKLLLRYMLLVCDLICIYVCMCIDCRRYYLYMIYRDMYFCFKLNIVFIMIFIEYNKNKNTNTKSSYVSDLFLLNFMIYYYIYDNISSMTI